MSLKHTLTALNLPPAVKMQTLKILARIVQAQSADDLSRASDRAEGFVLGMKTVEALNLNSIERLYQLFDHAAAARRREREQ